MLRSDVEEHEIGLFAPPRQSPLLGLELEGRLLGLLLLLRQLERAHLRGPCRVFLAQGMAAPGPRHQDATEVRMSLEPDPEHVPDFPLVPVRRGPDVGDGGKRGVLAFEGDLQADVLVAVIGEEVIHDGEIACRLAGLARAGPLIDRRQVVEHPEWSLQSRPEKAEDGARLLLRNPVGRDPVAALLRQQGQPGERPPQLPRRRGGIGRRLRGLASNCRRGPLHRGLLDFHGPVRPHRACVALSARASARASDRAARGRASARLPALRPTSSKAASRCRPPREAAGPLP